MFNKLCHFVEFESKLGLLVSRVVLMKDTVSNCLVNLLNSKSVKFSSESLITGFNSVVELLDDSLKLALLHLVSESLVAVNENTLLCGLNVSHFNLL